MCRSSWIRRRAQCRRISSLLHLAGGSKLRIRRDLRFVLRNLPHNRPRMLCPVVVFTEPSEENAADCHLRGHFHGTFRTTDRQAVSSRHISRTFPYNRPQIATPAVVLTEPSEKVTKKAPRCGRTYGGIRATDRDGVCKQHGLRKTPHNTPLAGCTANPHTGRPHGGSLAQSVI